MRPTISTKFLPCYMAVACVLLAGCGQKSTEADVIAIERNSITCMELTDYMTVERVIRIDTSEFVLGTPRKVVSGTDEIYLADRGGLHRFTVDGRYVGTIGRRGRGPGEYVTFADFDICGDRAVILDMNRKVLVFSTDGELIKSREIPFFASSCAVRNGKILLTSGYQEMTEKFHILNLDDLEEVSAFGEVTENELSYRHFTGVVNYYGLPDGKMLYHEPLNNTVYEIREDGYNPVAEINLFNKNVPASFWEHPYENIMDLNMKLEGEGYCYGLPLYATDGTAHLFTYKERSSYNLAYYDSRSSTTVQSEKISIAGLVYELPVANAVFSMNATTDISLSIQANYLEGEDAESGNPLIVLLRFN